MLPTNFVIPETTLRILRRTITIAPFNAIDCHASHIPQLLQQIILNLELAAIGNYSLVNTYPAEPQTPESPFNSITTLSELIFTFKTCLSEQRNVIKRNYGASFYSNLLNSLRTATTILNTAPIRPERSSPKPIHSAAATAPYLVFNPIFISLTLCHSRKKLVLNPYTSLKNTHSSLKERLLSNARKLKEGAQKKYSLLNNFPEKDASSSCDHPKNITDLQTLVNKLEKWIKHNSHPLLNQCGLSALRDIYKDLSEASSNLSLTCLPNLLQIDNQPQQNLQTSPSNASSSTSFQHFEDLPRERSLQKRAAAEEAPGASSSPIKKHRTESPTPFSESFDTFLKNLVTDSSPLGSPLNLEELVKTLRSEASPDPQIYQVEELTLVGSNVFTFTSINIQDLESWINNTHSLVGQCLNYPENLLVNSSTNLSALRHESHTNLRKFTLQQLLGFMKRHLPFLSKIQDQQNKQEAISLHSHLIDELTHALLEIEQACITTTQTQNPLQEKSGLNFPSPLTELEKYVSYKNYSNSPLSKKEESILDISEVQQQKFINPNSSKKSISAQEPFVSLRIHAHYFSVISVTIMQYASHIKKFIQQTERAMCLSSYDSKIILPAVNNSAQSDPLSVLSTLYHITCRNLYLYQKNNPHYLVKITQFLNPLLNTLNENYCKQQGLIPDPQNHHPKLVKLKVSDLNFCSVTAGEQLIPYISIYLKKKSTNTFSIRKTFIKTPIANSLTTGMHFLRSLQKHKDRMNIIASLDADLRAYIKCHDNSWPLTHKQSLTISVAQLQKIIIAIAHHNYQECLPYLKMPSDPTEQMTHSTYNQAEKILSSILNMPMTGITTPIATLITQASLSELSAISPETQKPLPSTYFITLLRPNQLYQLAAVKINSIGKRDNMLQFLLNQVSKIEKYLNTEFLTPTFHSVNNESRAITNKIEFILLLYYGIDINKLILKKYFDGTFPEKSKSSLEEKYTLISSLLNKFESTLQSTWNQLSKDKEIPPLEEIKHPFAKKLINLKLVL
ncbi:hypothetical protein CLAVI_000888 [Candidatus Clavichlamydia salmonicola]|uniref:hypothetical protein n=1 Tax=Candidatus Clavichlamydia salmonicola TaxID=469812 RepID=UPI001891DFD2|nr:hypothetical protein [Candidatus Clavichlamydia salmonicola]MBF5051247.1 hypothetical protein [Candidatus Clavichlamydia salmonicola]